MKLLPRDVKFYDLLLEQSKSVSEAAQQFHDLLDGDDAKRTESAGKLRELAKNGVAELRKVEIRLHETFVTPLDPENIHLLSRGLKTILDGIESLAYRISAYRIEPIPPAFKDLAGKLQKSAKAIQTAFE